MRLARISLTLSLHVSLSFIAFGRSSGLHPVSSHSCCMNVRAGRPAFDWPYAGVHRSTSLTISSFLLQQCPAYLVRLACIVFVIGGRWPYSWRRVVYCCQDLFNKSSNLQHVERCLDFPLRIVTYHKKQINIIEPTIHYWDLFAKWVEFLPMVRETRVQPKTQKMVLDTSLLNTQHYKVCIKGKVGKSEWSKTLPYTSV